MMRCFYRKPENFDPNDDDVLAALEMIRKSYLSLKDFASARNQELQMLRQQNDNLSKIIEQFKREDRSLNSPLRKRRVPSQELCGKPTLHDESSTDHCAIVRANETAEDLNVALNSEQLFNCTSADTTQLSPNASTSETEAKRSPHLLPTFKKRTQLQTKRRMRTSSNIESIAKEKKDESGWLGKEKKENKSESLACRKNDDTMRNFIEPQAVNRNKTDRLLNLSLKRNKTLKQTRLQCNAVRKEDSIGSDSTFCEEVIDESPNSHATVKQTKSARSWILRESNGNNRSSVQKVDQSNQPDRNSVLEHDENSTNEEFGKEIDFTFTLSPTRTEEDVRETSKKTPEAVTNSSPALETTTKQDNSTFDLKESVIILPPATQEIIFVDDSFSESTIIESMDLLQDVLKCHGESLDNLKRAENAKIKQLQKLARETSKGNSVGESLNKCLNPQKPVTEIIPASKIKQENAKPPPADDLDDFVTLPAINKSEQSRRDSKMAIVENRPFKENSNPLEDFTQSSLRTTRQDRQHKTGKENKLVDKVKEGKLSQHSLREAEKNPFDESSNDFEDFMPQPLVVKIENPSSEQNKNANTVQHKQLSLKEKFNINCRDCEEYIKFLGHRMSDEEIRQHLLRCTRHKACENILNSTPEGFWDPFIASFSASDPRNETLIDTRLCNKEN